MYSKELNRNAYELNTNSYFEITMNLYELLRIEHLGLQGLLGLLRLLKLLKQLGPPGQLRKFLAPRLPGFLGSPRKS